MGGEEARTFHRLGSQSCHQTSPERLLEQERSPGAPEAGPTEQTATDSPYSIAHRLAGWLAGWLTKCRVQRALSQIAAQAGSGAPRTDWLAGWLAGLQSAVCSGSGLYRKSLPKLAPVARAPIGWLAGWLAYKVPPAARRKIPCPSAAAQRAVGPQPIRLLCSSCTDFGYCRGIGFTRAAR